jgi:hypothetical protein
MKDEVLLQLLDMKSRGLSRTQKAEALGVDSTRIWQLEREPAFQAAWDRFVEQAMQEVRAQFMARSEKAGERIERLADQQANLRVALSANQDILDRAGFKPKQEIENVHVVRIERGTLEVFARAAREVGAGGSPPVVAGILEAELVLPDEGSPGPDEVDDPDPQGDGGLHPDPGTEDPSPGAPRPLQDDDRIGGLPNLAKDQRPE